MAMQGWNSSGCDGEDVVELERALYTSRPRWERVFR
jgi:hypothetical protein